MNELVRLVRTNRVQKQTGDIWKFIDRELNPQRSEAMLEWRERPWQQQRAERGRQCQIADRLWLGMTEDDRVE